MDLTELEDRLMELSIIYGLDLEECSIFIKGDLLDSYRKIVSEEKRTVQELKESVNQLFNML